MFCFTFQCDCKTYIYPLAHELAHQASMTEEEVLEKVVVYVEQNPARALQVMCTYLNAEKCHLSDVRKQILEGMMPLDEQLLQLFSLSFELHICVFGKQKHWMSHKTDRHEGCVLKFALVKISGLNEWLAVRSKLKVMVEFSLDRKIYVAPLDTDLYSGFLKKMKTSPDEGLCAGVMKYLQWRRSEQDVALMQQSTETRGQHQVTFSEDLIEPRLDQSSFEEIQERLSQGDRITVRMEQHRVEVKTEIPVKQIKQEVPDTTAGPSQKRAKCASPVQYGQCPRCDMPVCTVAAFKKHAQQNHPELIFFCHRPGCYSAYNTPAGMRAHVKKHQAQDDKGSTSPSIQCVAATGHKRKAPSTSEVTCDKCDKTFSRPDTL